MAGGSQIIINKDGITIITPAQFEAKAGQHLFKGGSISTLELPILPKSICVDCMKKASKNGSVFIKK